VKQITFFLRPEAIRFGLPSNFGHICGFMYSQNTRRDRAAYVRFHAFRSIDNETDASRRHSLLRELPGLKELPARLFAVGWAVAVVIATAGWFYFIFRVIWYFVAGFLQ
jgi:hypothetical protein